MQKYLNRGGIWQGNESFSSINEGGTDARKIMQGREGKEGGNGSPKGGH